MKNTTIPGNSIENRRNEGQIDTPGIPDHSETILKSCFFMDMVLILGMFHLSDSSALNRHQKLCL